MFAIEDLEAELVLCILLGCFIVGLGELPVQYFLLWTFGLGRGLRLISREHIFCILHKGILEVCFLGLGRDIPFYSPPSFSHRFLEVPKEPCQKVSPFILAGSMP